MLAVGAALQWELRPVLRALSRVRRLREGPVRVWHGRMSSGRTDVLVYRTGIGTPRARENTRFVLDHFRVSAVLNTGCAGGLSPSLHPGSVVVADRLLDRAAGEAPPRLTDRRWQDLLAQAARRAHVNLVQGTTVTSETVLATAEEKRAVFRETGAVAVDMEGTAIAAEACARGLPFASLRVILDEVDRPVPDLGGFATKGHSWFAGVAARALRKPGDVGLLLGLARTVRLCAHVLADIFSTLFQKGPVPEWIDDSP